MRLKQFLKLIRQVIKNKDSNKLKRLLNIGEAQDAGFGYCESGVSGSGMGSVISLNVINILRKNELFLKRGFLRLEELQWFDVSIGPDRVSDLCINILKREIISYTQEQCRKFEIPMEEVRVHKVFDGDSLEWISIKAEMPVNYLRLVNDAINPHPPILLLPKEAMKSLPLFLSYDEFYGFIDPGNKQKDKRLSKASIVKRAIEDPTISERFIKERETEKDNLFRPDFDSEIQKDIQELYSIVSGDRTKANRYRELVAKILAFIFRGEIELFDEERPTILGENRRDIIFQNISSKGIFTDFRVLHKASHIIVDAKNTDSVTSKDVSQVAGYLHDGIGNVAFIVSRKKQNLMRKHSYAQYTKQGKVIIFICDEEMKRWVTEITRVQETTGQQLQRQSPLKSIQNKYSDIVTD